MSTEKLLEAPGIPKLGWVADISTRGLVVHHGVWVEGVSGWFSEGVWDGDFSPEGLADASYLFGSAAVLDDHAAHFYTPTHMVERLLVADADGRVVISNSMPLILATMGSDLVDNHDYEEYNAITSGLSEYNPIIAVDDSRWRLRQFFYGSIDVDRENLALTYTRYSRPARFSSFAEYRSTLSQTIQRLVVNANDGRRMRAYGMSSMLSSGYDSTMVSVLAAEQGADTAYVRRRSNSLLPSLFRGLTSDDGTYSAVVLGMKTVDMVDRPPQPWNADIETALLAGSPGAREVAFLSMGVDVDRRPNPSAIFVGYHGDMVWGVPGVGLLHDPGHYAGQNIVRHDISGLTMAEARLVAGWVLVPLAFVGAEGIESLWAISTSTEMEPWRVGGDYDRPIARRIAEEAGIPRGSFGIRKRAAWGHIGRLTPRHPILKREFGTEGGWLGDTAALWQVRMRVLQIAIASRLGLKGAPQMVPAWYTRRSVAVFRAAVRRLRKLYAAGLNEA